MHCLHRCQLPLRNVLFSGVDEIAGESIVFFLDLVFRQGRQSLRRGPQNTHGHEEGHDNWSLKRR